MAEDTQDWSGTIVSVKAGPSGKFNIFAAADKTEFLLGADKGNGPSAGQNVEIVYRPSSYIDKKGTERTSNWIQNWKLAPATAKAPTPPPQPTPPQPYRNGNGTGNTFPTVEEQFVKEVVGGWAHAGLLACDPQAVALAVKAAAQAWTQWKAGISAPDEPPLPEPY